MSDYEKKIVAWFLPNKNTIKFDDSDDVYTLAANVVEKSNFEKYPILKGNTVSVAIKDEEVVYLRKEKGGKTSKKSTPKETPQSSSTTSDTKTMTVYAVAGHKGAMLFKEEKDAKKWRKISKELQEKDYNEIGLVAKNEVVATFDNEGVLIDVKLVAEPQKEEKKEETKTNKKGWSNRDEESTDKRSALMSAEAIISSMIKSGREEVNSVEKIKTGMNDLTNSLYKTLTEL